MTSCTCPKDPRTVHSTKRVYLYEPGAVFRDGPLKKTDSTKVHIFSADCPLHGYTVLEPEEGSAVAGRE
jgi:hypothetical protein